MCYLKFQGKNKAERHSQEVQSLLSSSWGAKALISRCYLWAEAMQAIHISSKGHCWEGIKWAVPPSAELCMIHGRDRLACGADFKYCPGRGVFLKLSSLASLRGIHRVATLGTWKLDSINLLQDGLAQINTNQPHTMSGDGWTDAYLKPCATETFRGLQLYITMCVIHIWCMPLFNTDAMLLVQLSHLHGSRLESDDPWGHRITEY